MRIKSWLEQREHTSRNSGKAPCFDVTLERLGYESVGMYASCSSVIQRLLAVISPHSLKDFTRPKATTFFIAIPWTICFIMRTFLASDAQGLVMKQVDYYPSERCFIQSISSWPSTSIFLYVFIQPHVPLVTICGCYLVIFITTLKQIRRERQPNNDRRVETLMRRLDLSQGLFVCYLWHMVGGYQFIYSAGILPDLSQKKSPSPRIFARSRQHLQRHESSIPNYQ
ncbi:hypothetical protein RvY_06047 [Ramazzottius varieornatus]|uniref:G-protein coupled receptors family 1 profile domain-containing protein n=1 Tax=Ramazzottius varieornatus TaxID=947166 RepID=A0A1D1UX80_RAMVA|nr:hypothetical protein RvY_06047 [Ramazzottius varieornatus]